MPHPLFGPYDNLSGANGMRAGDRVIYIDGRHGIADAFLHDGEALVTWEDGTYGVVNWAMLRRAETIERCALLREIDMTGFARPDNTSICDWREVSCHHCGGNGIVAAYSRNEAVHA